jgi:capsular exopolysaccharide synthesis family protein
MESFEHLEQVDFQKYWLVLKRRWLPASTVFTAVVGLAVTTVLLKDPVYEAQGRILVNQDRLASLTGLQNDLGEIVPIGEKTNPISTEAQIVKSLPIAQEAVKELRLTDEEGNLVDPEDLQKALEVAPVTGTDILSIASTANDPQKVAAIVNKVMQVYMESNVEVNRDKARKARKFIEQELPKVEEIVKQADIELRDFKQKYRVVALPEEARVSVETLGKIDEQVSQLKSQLANATAQSEEFRNKLGLTREQAVAVTSVSQSPGVQEVLTELQKTQTQLASERRRFRESAPKVVSLKRKEAELSAVLQDRVNQVLGGQASLPIQDLQVGLLKQNLTADFVRAEVQRESLASQLKDLTQSREAYKKRADILPQVEQKQRELERKVQASQTTYETLLNKLQETRVAENQAVGNARIVSWATVPEKRSGPSKKLYLGGGIVAGTLLGVATAFLLDLIDKSVKTVKEAKELFGYTLLGVIPAFGKSKKTRRQKGLEGIIPRIVAKDLPSSPIAQAYQMLQANLKFLTSDKPLKAIVVTSSVPQEGKSEVCANLAAAMAQVGRRVLLVDADMRHPSQHHLWELTNAVGLSNILVGEADLNTAVNNVMSGLDVLTSGVVPPNPVALLDSKRMASLMETFATNYDFVIVDTPPLAGIADAPILGKMADGILLVVRPGVVDSASASAAKDFLARSGQNVLGLVANGVVIKNEPDSYFYYTQGDYAKQDSVSNEQAAVGIGNEG